MRHLIYDTDRLGINFRTRELPCFIQQALSQTDNTFRAFANATTLRLCRLPTLLCHHWDWTHIIQHGKLVGRAGPGVVVEELGSVC
jgi:hypothetical protein